MKLMLTINMTMNMMFLIMKHPLSMGLTIILQTTIISMITGMTSKSFWFSYILFLMYIGGMMVLFIYMTSLIPNMMFNFKKNKMMMMLMLSMVIILLMNKNNIWANTDMMTTNYKMVMLMKMYNKPINVLLIMIASYLLFTMITVFKITESNSGPLRMSFN
uniref:NADH dehydrogenase subunit 6 n=1 Tax=Marmessoidea bispina TaxID=2878957 RepID=UPI0025A9A882|nr:NADH dehydrogenase subunit 6 [Marmessoidea bispina]WID87078.1 NADH dehydrogenase subunit 6 [Marmessoidea bispina]